MPSTNSFTATIDRREEQKFLKGYSASAVEHILGEAAKEGGKAGAAVLKSNAPIGTSARLSQFYRKMGWGHGKLRGSVRAAMIRGRNSFIPNLQGRTIGYVIGPIGKAAFTRAWVEGGTARGEAANPWVESGATAALSVAREASEAVLTLYAEAHNG